jgi:pyruvate kinase
VSRPYRRTKIVATVGPSTASREGIAALLASGMDVARFNTSHGNWTERTTWMGWLREEADRLDMPAAVLVDLTGPRIRVGTLAEPITLVSGHEVSLAPEDVAGPDDIPVTYDALATDVGRGARILLNEGLLVLEVVESTPPRIRARVEHGGLLESRKGINLPGVSVTAPALTEKDVADAAEARLLDAEYVALSFVRRAEDIEAVRAVLPPPTKLIAKIEKDTALHDITRILEAADGIMVARGDLGVELPFEQVPLVQKQLIREANAVGKVVITATQMLESMVQHPRPTRAEASDVANAILDGTDAVMLSAETAIGEYPLEAVGAMDRIIRSVEAQAGAREGRRHFRPHEAAVADAIALATTSAARMLHTPLIVCFTKSGFTARMVAAHRPRVPILAVTTERRTYLELALVWGVVPMLVHQVPDYDAMLEVVRESITASGHAVPGDRIVVTAGLPWDVSGTTNLLKVETV